MPDDTPWYSTLAPEEQAHVVAKGWDKDDLPTAAGKAIRSHFAAERLIGVPSDQVLRLPKDATDPAYQAALDRLHGMNPTKPEDYKFEGVDEKVANSARDLAVKHKLPVAAAQQLAADLAAVQSATGATQAADAALTKAANNAFLKASYGADYDLKVFTATRALAAAGLPASVLEHVATLSQDQYKAAIDAFVGLGAKMGEAELLRGGNTPSDPTTGMTGEQAAARLGELQNDGAWVQKYLGGDAAARAEFTKLTTLIAEGRVPRAR